MSYEEGNRVSKALARTTIWCHGRKYVVSTIDRTSSCMYGGRFAETMVWEHDVETAVGDPGKIVYQNECIQGSIRVHQQTVEALWNGTLFQNQEEEGDDA